MTASDIPKLRETLITEGIVTPEQVAQALSAQKKYGGHLLETLIHLGHMDVKDYERVIAKLPEVVSLELSHCEIFKDTVELVPERLALKHRVFPIDRLGPLLTLGMAIPLDRNAIAEVEQATGLRVKPVYCNPSDIDCAIYEHYQRERYDVESVVRDDPSAPNRFNRLKTVAKVLHYIDDMPALPETVRVLREALDDPEVELQDIEDALNRDPLAASKILALANSAAYGLPGEVADLGMAMRMLGLKEVYNLFFSSAVLSVAESTRHFNYIKFFRTARFAAQATVRIASELNISVSTELRTAGLLHDIGEFALAKVVPEGRERITGDLKGLEKVRREEAVLGISHAELGYAVLDHWDLPESVIDIVRNHHAPSRSEKCTAESNVVSIAAHLAEMHDHVETDAIEFSELTEAMSELGLSAEQLTGIYRDLLEAKSDSESTIVAV